MIMGTLFISYQMSFKGHTGEREMKRGQLCSVPELDAAVGIAGKLGGRGHAPRVRGLA